MFFNHEVVTLILTSRISDLMFQHTGIECISVKAIPVTGLGGL
jgi:hypothetical protein